MTSRLAALSARVALRLIALIAEDHAKLASRWEPIRRKIRVWTGQDTAGGILRDSALTASAFWICRRLRHPGLTRLAGDLVAFPPSIQAVLNRPGPLILSVPHYGPFLLCAIALRARLSGRAVTILFQDPSQNSGNIENDAVLKRVYGEKEIGYDDRKGGMRALKTLKAGGVCVLMPDVTRSDDNTFFVAFLGGAIQVQPGVAALARIADARILPAYPFWEADGSIGIEVGTEIVSSPRQDAAQSDYVCMSRVFDDFSRQLAHRPIGWVYWALADQRIKPWNQAGQAEAVAAALRDAEQLHRPAGALSTTALQDPVITPAPA